MSPLSGWQFVDGKFQDVEYLIEQNELLFQQQIIPKGGPDQYMAAIPRMIDARRWTESAALIEPMFDRVLRELEIFYVPKQLAPGPCFCFVHRDTKGMRTRAKIRPYGWDLIMKDGPAKYGMLGLKYSFHGPLWLGNSDEALQAMVDRKRVVLVEGPFDLLACRLVTESIPILTSGTKKLNDMHFLYLKLLGVTQVHLMFDHEQGKAPGEWGAGDAAMRMTALEAERYGMQVYPLLCPGHDPSACLETYPTARKLKKSLEILF